MFVSGTDDAYVGTVPNFQGTNIGTRENIELWNRRNRLGVSVTRHAPPFPRFPAPASMSNDFRRLLAPGSPPTSSSR